MDPYRDANAPPPYSAQEGQPCMPYPLGEKGQMNQYPSNPQYAPQGPIMYPPQGQAYPPQAQAYTPLPQAPQIINFTQGPAVIRNISVGQDPMRLQCPSCHAHIKSSVTRSNTMKTHLIALFLCVMCCWPCICVPYCMSSCKDTNHKCPECKAFLGTYRS